MINKILTINITKTKLVGSFIVLTAMFLLGIVFVNAQAINVWKTIDSVDFIKMKINGADTISGVLPFEVEFELELDPKKQAEYWMGKPYNELSKAEIKRFNILMKERSYQVSFGDDELFDRRCRLLDDTYKYKDLICDQPLQKIRFKFGENYVQAFLPSAVNKFVNYTVRDDGIIIMKFKHRYVYNGTFNPKVYIVYKNSTKGESDDYVLISNLTKTVNVSVPIPEVFATPIVSVSDSSREIKVSCPILYEFGYMTINGDKTSIDSPGFIKSGDRYIFQTAGIRDLSIAVSPTQQTSYGLYCILDGAFEYRDKYQTYKRYIGTLPDVSPYAKNSISLAVSDNPITTCQEQIICSVDSNGNSIVVDISNTCEETVVETCDLGCQDGACITECIPKTGNYCLNGDVYRDDNSCNPTKVQECGNYSCVLGQCVDIGVIDCPTDLYCSGNDVYRQYSTSSNECRNEYIETCSNACVDGFCVGWADLESVLNLTANPALVKKGDTTNLTWEVNNAESCLVSGDNGDVWSTARGNVTSVEINKETIYTLTCQGRNGDTLEQSVTVRVVPNWQEI